MTVSEDGRVSVADLGSTNGTSLDGADVHDRPVRLAPGALLRLGESTLRLTSGTRTPTLTTTPDGEGHLRVALAEAAAPGAERAPAAGGPHGTGGHGQAYGTASAAHPTHRTYDDEPARHDTPQGHTSPQVTHGRGAPLADPEPPDGA